MCLIDDGTRSAVSCLSPRSLIAKVTFNYLFIYYSSKRSISVRLVRKLNHLRLAKCGHTKRDRSTARVWESTAGQKGKKCQMKHRRCRSDKTYNLIKLSLKTKTLAETTLVAFGVIFVGIDVNAFRLVWGRTDQLQTFRQSWSLWSIVQTISAEAAAAINNKLGDWLKVTWVWQKTSKKERKNESQVKRNGCSQTASTAKWLTSLQNSSEKFKWFKLFDWISWLLKSW